MIKNTKIYVGIILITLILSMGYLSRSRDIDKTEEMSLEQSQSEDINENNKSINVVNQPNQSNEYTQNQLHDDPSALPSVTVEQKNILLTPTNEELNNKTDNVEQIVHDNSY